MSDKIALIINSCEAFYQKTLPQFLHHAQQTGIPFHHIYVVVGETPVEHPQLNQILLQPYLPNHTPSPEPEEEQEQEPPKQYHIIHSPYINIDYNAAIFFSQTPQGREELQKYTHFFYIHDTADLMNHFWEKIRVYATVCMEYIKLSQTHTKNIGLFNTQWFLENKSTFLQHIQNTDPEYKRDYKTGCFPNKDWLYQNIPRLCPWNLGEDCLFDYDDETGQALGSFFHNDVQTFFANFYGSTEPRKVTLYQEPGIVKYQKNWGQSGATWSTEL
jgi:hypothetical protein